MNEYEFKQRRLVTYYAMANGVKIDPERINMEVRGNVIQAVMLVATQEEPLYHHPRIQRWTMFKHFFFPKWLKKWFPVKQTEVIAIHKYPEVDSHIGKEFIHLKTMDYDEFLKMGKPESESKEVWNG